MNIINPFLNPSSGVQFYHSPEPSFVLSNTLLIKEINQSAETLFGIRKNEALGENFLKICKDRNIVSLIQDHLKFILSGNVYELENKNGESIFKIKCHPISDPSLPKGIYNMIIVVFSEANKENGLSIHDISIHQNYSPMNFLMKEALQIAEIGFYCMNRDHIYLDCNPWTCHFVGAKFPEEVKGRNIFELAKVYDWPQHVAQEIYHVDEGIMAIGIPRFNIPTILPQGPNLPPVYQYNTKYPIFNRQGKVTGLVGAVSDSQFQFFKSN